MKVTAHRIDYGRGELQLQMPETTVTLEVREPEKTITPELFQMRLEEFFLAHPPDLSRTVIVVADKTRLCGYPLFLPVLLNTLADQGLEKGSLKFIIAYGTHARQSDAECLEAYGDLYTLHEFVHHNCEDIHNFAELGRSSRNTPVRVRRDLLEATTIVTFGAVSHHYFAGFGGGRKLLFPGCGERSSIYRNHSLFLDLDKGQLAAGCQPGVLDSSPLAEDLFEIETYLPATLAIHGILDSHGQLCDLLVGRTRQDFLKACDMHRQHCETESTTFPLVVASCGGFPKDINFIQSHKAVHNGAMFVRDGGLLLVYCECRDRVGSKTFLPWFEFPSFAAAFAELSRNYEGNGGTALALMTKLQRIRIGLVTELDRETCRLMGVEKWTHDQVQAHLVTLPRNSTPAFIPNSSLLVKRAGKS
jgi:nickel-dependent lactate racemase